MDPILPGGRDLSRGALPICTTSKGTLRTKTDGAGRHRKWLIKKVDPKAEPNPSVGVSDTETPPLSLRLTP